MRNPLDENNELLMAVLILREAQDRTRINSRRARLTLLHAIEYLIG
jgi:hypothetical protein